MNKKLTLGLGFLILCSACAPSAIDEAPNEDVDTDGTSTPDSDGNDGGEVVLNFWHIDPGEKGAVYERAVERFEENHPNAQVNVLRIPNDDYKQRMVVAMSGGDPDVFHSWGGSWLNEFVEAGSVMSLDQTDVDFDQYLDVALDNATFEEEIYGVPLGVSLTLFFYNTGIFEELGLDTPKDYDEFMTVVETLRDNDYYPLALANQTGWTGAYYQEYLVNRLAGEGLYDDALQREGAGFDDENYVRANEKIQDLVDMDAFNPGFNGIPYDAGQGRQLMYSEQAAMMLITTSFLNNVRDEAPQYEDDLGVFPFPTIEGGEGDGSNLLGSGAPVWSVYEDTEHEELAIELIKELSNEETSIDYMDSTASMSAYEGLQSDDAFVQQFIDLLQDANYLGMPYDQTMPPSVAQVHLDAAQEVLGNTLTPEEAADLVEEAAQNSLD
ncbi:LOW QUALITY PROTEIN: xylose ABC transporter, substrate-binding component [Geomicrobium sp. JCM 19037]|nr:LOW QUALITY PROTEIN: xylose ABC transporter, substrate-binding component [Geomicrobium sp. JCM 19037]